MKYIITLFLILLFVLLNKPFFYISNKENFTNKLSIDKIYCINLDRSKERWEIIKENANKSNIEIHRFEGIDGNIIDKKMLEKKYNIKINHKLRKGTIGCALSHISLIKKISEENNNYVLILEDDVIIPEDFNKKVNSYLSKIDFDFDILFLGGCNIYGHEFKTNFVKPIQTDDQHLYRYNLCCHAMLINKKNIHKILKVLSSIDRSIDTQLRNSFGYLNVYYCNPQIIFQNRELLSDLQSINNKRKNKPNRYKSINNVTLI